MLFPFQRQSLVCLNFFFFSSFATKDPVSLSESFPADFEASGVAWSPSLERLVAVGDEDAMATLSINGSCVTIVMCVCSMRLFASDCLVWCYCMHT